MRLRFSKANLLLRLIAQNTIRRAAALSSMIPE